MRNRAVYERSEKRRAYKKRYQQENAVKIKEHKMEYRAKNRVILAEKDQLRQATQWSRIIVSGSKKADHLRNRSYDIADYITKQSVEETLTKQNGRCIYCHMRMIYGVNVNRQTDEMAVTPQRIDNAIAHIRTNTALCCRLCNARARCIPHATMLEHGNNLRECIFLHCAYKDHEGDRVVTKHEFTKAGDYCKNCEHKRWKTRS